MDTQGTEAADDQEQEESSEEHVYDPEEVIDAEVVRPTLPTMFCPQCTLITGILLKSKAKKKPHDQIPHKNITS